MKTRLLFSAIALIISVVVHGQVRPKIDKIFSISPTSVQFTSEGGTKEFIAKSNSPWNISTNTRSWGHLNSLTLTVDI